MTREEAINRIMEIDIRGPLQEDYDALNMAIKALEQEPCEDAISRQAVLDLISKFILEIHTEGGRDLNAHTNDVLRQILRNVGSDRVLPSVNPQEPFKPMVEIDLYSVIKQKYIERDVLDKIIAEIKETRKRRNVGVMECLDIIDRYKAESEDKE